MEKEILIRTKLEIGEFIGYSIIDGIPIRKINREELMSLNLPLGSFELIQNIEDHLKNNLLDFDENKNKMNILKPDLKYFEIDWDKIKTLKDMKPILKLVADKIVIDFNKNGDVEIYNNLKKYFKN